MNKAVLIVGTILALQAPMASNAQVYVGLKAGVGITTLQNVGKENTTHYHYTPGLSFPYAAFCDIRLSSRFSIQAELGHAMLGARKSGIYPLQQAEDYGTGRKIMYTDCPGETRLNYITSAILVKYSYPISPLCHAYIALGIAPELLLQAEEASNGNGHLYESADENTVVIASKYIAETTVRTSSYRSWNWSLAGAGGLRWEMYREYVFVALNARRGLQPIQRETNELRNTTAMYALSVGYGFRL